MVPTVERGFRLRCLLLYGNYRAQAIDLVHIRPLEVPDKLPGISRKGFHVPSLSFCINGVKGKRGLPAAAKPGKYHKLVTWNYKVNVLQIMNPCSENFQVFFHRSSLNSSG